MSNVRSQVKRLLEHVSILDGRQIVKWVGLEMALTDKPVLWEHPSVPYLQCTELNVYLEDGTFFQMLAQLEDGTGFHGFYFFGGLERPPLDPGQPYETGSIYRTRELTELPLGVARVVHVRRDGPNAEIEFQLQIGASVVRALAGEIHEEQEGALKVVAPEESILLQVNGLRPNPSIERTSSSRLRLPPLAAHVER
jgi:hypothetical protein